MSEKKKIEKVVGYFEKIVELFPKGGVSLCIHRIDLDALDKRVWEKVWIEPKDGNGFWVLKSKRELDITLF